MRVEGTFKTPIHGISTLAPRNRADGQAELQVNLRSDPVQKLTRRPSLVYKAHLADIATSNDVEYHDYTRDGVLFRILVNKTTGDVHCFKGETLELLSSDIASYLTGGDIVMRTIENTTYVLNKNIKVLKGTSTDTVRHVTHINVTSALNYGESVTVGIGKPSDSPAEQVTYSVPDLGATPDYDTADKARATTAVATGIADLLNAMPSFSADKTAITTGSTVAIYADNGEWVDMYIESGQGDRTTKVFGRQIESPDGLPLYAAHGTRITVRPNPSSAKGVYYLQAERTTDDPIIEPTDPVLDECVWAENRSPFEVYDIDASTMPHTITYDPDADDFTVAEGGWKDRRTGDDESCPFPTFMDNRIVDLGHFQNRLVFASKGMVFMSETEDYENWFKASAVKLLVTDPVGIGSNAVDTDDIDHISSHNKDLLLISPNGQFKIDGSVAVTPQSVSMPKVSSFECQTSVAPVPMGASVMLAIQQGQSGGVLDYTTKANTEQELAFNISRHVVGLIDGNVTRMVGSVNSDMLAMMSDGGPSNVIYIYERYDERGKILQNSWSTWEFPDDIEITDLTFKSNKLTVITKHNDKVALYEIDLYSRVTRDTDEVFLDYMLTLESSDGSEVTLPSNYTFNTNTIVVRGKDCEYALFRAQYTKVGDTLVFKENISGGVPCKVYVGVPVIARYIPTRPFRRDESGIVITTDRIRVARWLLSVVDTHEVDMRIHSDYVTLDDQSFTGRVMGQTSNIIGEKVSYTGDLRFSYAQDASLARAEFRTEGYLGLTIAGISWDGQYYRTSGRL